MTQEQLEEMKAARLAWFEHRARPGAYPCMNILEAMQGFEVGWCMARGIALREEPLWNDQPGLKEGTS